MFCSLEYDSGMLPTSSFIDERYLYFEVGLVEADFTGEVNFNFQFMPLVLRPCTVNDFESYWPDLSQ